ncbi:hypothetical protein Y032_0997g3343 [Ancylostoma ceylanicum]|uniref:Uncharacterized protein n=1 Tax=Ancylostoma ceylanicum TaxID=53326 RepID=A0A016W8T7_9BILA|nr:hypothetical protein Y032_0997g3343 [Ancylostoma ceylanicum]
MQKSTKKRSLSKLWCPGSRCIPILSSNKTGLQPMEPKRRFFEFPETKISSFLTKDLWSLNSPDLNHWTFLFGALWKSNSGVHM